MALTGIRKLRGEQFWEGKLVNPRHSHVKYGVTSRYENKMVYRPMKSGTRVLSGILGTGLNI